jgi:carbamoyl-phosphate synthase small subunit
MKKSALIMLENGYFEFCESFTGDGESFGEFVFNTAMTGYEEILTDPSYKGQIINFTYPLIGNYGVSGENFQSDKIHASGVIISELSLIPSNYKSTGTFANFLIKNGITGVHKVDTRSLTRQIRIDGAIKGGITTLDLNPESFLEKVKESPSISDVNLFLQVVDDKAKVYEGIEGTDFSIIAIDFGIKNNIIRDLQRYFKKIYLVPFDSNFDKNIAELEFEGVFLSNGPGDPRIVYKIDKYLHDFVFNGFPLIGICFGHQLIGKAFNLEVEKLPFGHHGGNHPVKEMQSGKVFITSQNHNYAVSKESIEKSDDWEVTWLHLNDNTVSGMQHKHLPIASVQFHPEASPGPNDANKSVFENFFNIVKSQYA